MIYQFSACSLQVIIESNIQPGIPPIPILPTVMFQLDKVEVHELKPKMLTKDKGGLVWR